MRLALPLVLILGLLACSTSSSTSSTSSPSDGGASDASTTDASSQGDAAAPDAGLGCAPGDFTGVAPVQPTSASADPPSSPSGGAPRDGVYVLTTSTHYIGDAAAPTTPLDEETGMVELAGVRVRFTYRSPAQGPSSMTRAHSPSPGTSFT